MRLGKPGPGWASLPAVRAAELPGEPFATFPDERVTFGQLDARIAAMARRLQAAGVRRGDRVGIMLPGGSVDFVALLFAAAKVGAIAVSVNARYKQAELGYVARHAGLRILLADARYDEVVEAAGVRELCPVHRPSGDPVFDDGAERVADADVAAAEAEVGGDDPALMLYTSGTTARPKGVLLSHHGLLHQAQGFATRLRLTADDRFWTPLPLFHSGGICTSMGAFAAGATLVHVGEFEPGGRSTSSRRSGPRTRSRRSRRSGSGS